MLIIAISLRRSVKRKTSLNQRSFPIVTISAPCDSSRSGQKLTSSARNEIDLMFAGKVFSVITAGEFVGTCETVGAGAGAGAGA
jgi:hypothetical protein